MNDWPGHLARSRTHANEPSEMIRRLQERPPGASTSTESAARWPGPGQVSDVQRGPGVPRPKLSVCIATFKRATFIGETLESILGQVEPGVEVVVVDGASPDDTEEVVRRLAVAHSGLRYHREPVNSGVDADYDKAVGYAQGEYCWLMTDDDVLVPGAIARV